MHNQTGPSADPVSRPASPAGVDGDLNEAAQRALLGRVTLRLMPLLFLSYIIAYIDRINVGFAKLHFREALGVDAKGFEDVFGHGAGLFFIGYFLFEVPSNLILQRVGARVWIARIMIVWGFVSMAFMFMKSVTAFYVMRFLLGAAEAGFFPGVVLYLTYWYPAKDRARMVAYFALGGVMAGVVGSPISGAILKMNGFAGIAGWQWLFLLEGIPAVLVGFIVLWVLPNGPEKVPWLNDREKSWIRTRLSEEAAVGGQTHRLADIFTSGRVWLLCVIYFLLNVGAYGFEMWAPTIVKEFSGLSDFGVGLVNAIPYVTAGVVMLLVGRHSDQTGERRGHVAASAIGAAIGFVLAAYFKSPVLAMACMAIAFAGLKSTLGPFWAMTTAFLTGSAAAGGIALINSVGNLGGYFGPRLVGLLKSHTSNNFAALMMLAGALLGMGLFALLVPVRKSTGTGTGKTN